MPETEKLAIVQASTMSMLREALPHLNLYVRYNVRTATHEILGLQDDIWQPVGQKEALAIASLCEEHIQQITESGLKRWRPSSTLLLGSLINLSEPYDAVKERFETLPEWDGIPRARRFLIDYAGAKDTAYVQHVTLGLLLGIYHRAVQPGCYFDYMPILVGDQGAGKSLLLKLLALSDDTLYSDSFQLTGDLRRNLDFAGDALVVEASELNISAFATHGELKQFISACVDHYRKPYASAAQAYKRGFLLVATANPSPMGLIPSDTSGSRRYAPIEVPFPTCLLYTSPSPRDRTRSRMPSSA